VAQHLRDLLKRGARPQQVAGDGVPQPMSGDPRKPSTVAGVMHD
jgi:hypothetical protein